MSKRIFFKFIFISIITLVTFSSCKKEEINSVNLEFFPDTLLFDYDVDTNTVVLNCFGDIQTTWSLSSLPSYINVSPTSGTLTPGQSITLNVILDRSGFVSNDTYLDAIVITYKSGANYTTLTTQVKNFKQKKILLYKDVVDAEFDENGDRIVFVSSNPGSLNVIQTFQNPILSSVVLPYVPLCVSLSPSGNEAVIGHDGRISIVDLINMQVTQTYNISCQSYDIVHGGNGWAYVFPANLQWTKIHCINLATGAETKSTGISIYGNTKAKLYPLGNFIYGADKLSPSDIEKYDITAGTADYLYDSPYHGEYNFAGDIWFSKNNNILFSKGRTTVNTSLNQSQDMIYQGTLIAPFLGSSYSYLTGMYQPNSNNKILCIFSTGTLLNIQADSSLYIIDATTLANSTRISYEPFLSPLNTLPDRFVPALGHFVFGSPIGNKAYVLTKAQAGSGITYDWALQVINY